MRKNKKINIIYKDDQIVVCEKPKGIPVSSDKTGDMDLLHQLKNQLFFEENTDGEPQLYLVHRLDRPVGGVMVFARTKKAAASLTEQIKDHTFEKDYQAVLTGWLPDDEGTFRDYLLKDPKNNVSKIVKEGTPGAKEAILDYEVIDMMEDSKMKYTYCLIHLETGRHHQIRVQTSSRGFGIWGDTKYNPIYQKTKKKYKEIGGIVHTPSPEAVAWAQAGRDIPLYGTTHADYFFGPIPCARNLTPQEIEEAYEKNTGKVIIETFEEREINPMYTPAVLCKNHGPFTWGKDAAEAVHNAVVLEEVAKMAKNTELLNPKVLPAPDCIKEKHFYRKHGANAYYGQN